MILINNAFLLVMTGALAIASCGSSLGVKNIYFDYEKPSVKTEKGFVNLTFNPSPRNSVESNQEIVVWTKPYRFNTQYISSGGNFINGQISELTITSVRSGEIVYSADLIHDTFSRTRPDDEFTVSPKEIVGFGAGPLSMTHEDYRVSFEFVIYGENSSIYDKGSVSVVVKKKYFEKVN